MDRSLLATRIQIPPEPRHHVQRPRLVEAIERNLPYHKLLLVLAPAGYGKSTLLAEWARSTQSRVGWLHAGEEHNNAERLLRYLLAAWERFDPEIRSTSLGLLLEPSLPDLERVLAAFVNHACDQPEQTVFVLDDAHVLDDPTVLDTLTFLIDNLPSHFHLILAGRAAPLVPLARYRAAAGLWELHPNDMAFQTEETSDFFRSATGIDISANELDQLQTSLEGWIAGLQLISLSAERFTHDRKLDAVSSKQRFIADYVQSEVLAGLDERVRQFLQQTSILDTLCGDLCNAVTGRNDGQAMLDLLERTNLFTAPLDDRREWFRYHPLLAGVLRDELQRQSPTGLVALHGRAARWYLERDMPEAAFVHAVAADDIDTGTRLLDGYVIMNLESGEFRIVERWLDSTPPAWFSANPSLGLYQGALKAFQGDIDGLVQVLDEAEAQIAAQNRDDASLQLAKITVARCAAACFQNNVPLAERYASQALAGLRPEDDTLRANIHHALADSYRRNHRWSEAREHYLRIITTLTTDPSWKVRSAHVYGALADLELMQGRLREAHDLWNKARAAIEQPRVWGLLPVPIIGWVYIRLAELLYEWNALTEASALLPKGLERAELGGDVRAMIAGHLIAGRMALSEGDLERAGEHLERASPLVDQSAFTEWNSRFERLQLELWLVQNRLRAAVEWSDRMQLDDAHSLEPEGDVTQLAIARVLIFKGDADARMQALDRLATTIDVAMRDERKGVLIEALALQAIALSAAGDVAGAMTSLERALGLAEPEGYLRVFADLGLPMARVLQEARSRSVMPEYVDRLLACVAGDLGEASSRTEVLVEPLSARELEVLGLIAAGLTNREIAAKLFISAETVKKHTSSIYAKLQVKHRTEAIARARELHLLQP